MRSVRVGAGSLECVLKPRPRGARSQCSGYSQSSDALPETRGSDPAFFCGTVGILSGPSTPTVPESRPLLTVPEVAERLRVTDRTVRRWANAGVLERVKLGDRLVRFTPESIEALIRPTSRADPGAGGPADAGQKEAPA